MNCYHVAVNFVVLLSTDEELVCDWNPSLQLASGLVHNEEEIVEDDKEDSFWLRLLDEGESVLIKKFPFFFEDGVVRSGVLSL